MGVLEQVTNLKKEGMKDNEISNELQKRGISPGDINDAFNQLKVKRAISADESFEIPQPQYNMQNNPQNKGQFYKPRTKDIEEPIPEEMENINSEEYYSPQNYENPPIESYPASQGVSQQEYYPQYNYDEYSPQTQTGATDTDTVIEIAEQVLAEKTKKIQKQIETLTDFASIAETKMQNNDERLKRIEKMIDSLQIKILEKVGSYGDNLSSLKKEMSMMEESFSKILPELVDAKKHSHSEHKPK